jgi:hypothetical protein
MVPRQFAISAPGQARIPGRGGNSDREAKSTSRARRKPETVEEK